MTIFVLEGPDFAGKSSHAESIASRLVGGSDIIHNGPDKEYPPERLFAKYVTQVAHAINSDRHTIFDRLHVGELIYGPAYRNESRLSFYQIRAIDDMLDDVGAVKVFVDAEDVDLVSRFRGERGDDLVKDEETLLKIAKSYRVLLDPHEPDPTPLLAGLLGFPKLDRQTLPGWVHWTSAHGRAAGNRG